MSKKTIERIALAVDYLDAEEVSPGTYKYYADEVSEYFIVTEQEMRELGDLLSDDTPDAYSLWCAYAGREANEEGT